MFSARFHNHVLALSFKESVGTEEMLFCLKRVECILGSVMAQFCLLIDLTGLDRMDHDCATDLGRIMDLCNEKGVSRVVSVVPDPTKDIGLRLLSLFHVSDGVGIELYGNRPDAMEGLP
jgi:anti-anti-sigma regulatory factor